MSEGKKSKLKLKKHEGTVGPAKQSDKVRLARFKVDKNKENHDDDWAVVVNDSSSSIASSLDSSSCSLSELEIIAIDKEEDLMQKSPKLDVDRDDSKKTVPVKAESETDDDEIEIIDPPKIKESHSTQNAAKARLEDLIKLSYEMRNASLNDINYFDNKVEVKEKERGSPKNEKPLHFNKLKNIDSKIKNPTQNLENLHNGDQNMTNDDQVSNRDDQEMNDSDQEEPHHYYEIDFKEDNLLENAKIMKQIEQINQMLEEDARMGINRGSEFYANYFTKQNPKQSAKFEFVSDSSSEFDDFDDESDEDEYVYQDDTVEVVSAVAKNKEKISPHTIYHDGCRLTAEMIEIIKPTSRSSSVVSSSSNASNVSSLRLKYLKKMKSSNLNFYELIKRYSPFSSTFNLSSMTSLAANDTGSSATSRIRAYVHQRNVQLNGLLTLLAMLAITAGLSVGVGHFIGWNNHLEQQSQLSMAQVYKLRQLQEDLLVCMQTEDENMGFIQETVCKGNKDYWRIRFEKLFEENNNLMELFQKTQMHYQQYGNHQIVIGENDCVNESTSDEFLKLRLDLLVKQMEYLKLLGKLEEVIKSRKQINVLRGENFELKQKLIEEEADDQEIVDEWKSKYSTLESENEELRKTFEVDEIEDQQMIDGLKEEIVLLSKENFELKSVLDQMYNDLVLSQIEKIRAKEHKTYEEFRMLSFADIGIDPEFEPIEEETLFRGKYSNLQKRVLQLYNENVELKEKMTYLQKLVKKLEDEAKKLQGAERLAETRESENEKNMKSYSHKLSSLQKQLRNEQKETNHWRVKYDELKRKQRKEAEDKKNNEDDYKRTQEEKENTKQHDQSKSGQEKDAFVHFAESTEKALKSFIEKFKTKWEDWNANGKRKLKQNKAAAGKYFKEMLKSVNKYSEKLVYNGIVSSEAIYSYFSDRIGEVSSVLSKIKKGQGSEFKNYEERDPGYHDSGRGANADGRRRRYRGSQRNQEL